MRICSYSRSLDNPVICAASSTEYASLSVSRGVISESGDKRQLLKREPPWHARGSLLIRAGAGPFSRADLLRHIDPFLDPGSWPTSSSRPSARLAAELAPACEPHPERDYLNLPANRVPPWPAVPTRYELMWITCPAAPTTTAWACGQSAPGCIDAVRWHDVRTLNPRSPIRPATPTLIDRTWVLLTEAPDGRWGLAAHANTNAELVAVARAQIA